MNKLVIIAGGLLGLAFVFFGLTHFINIIEMPPPPEDSNAAKFFALTGPTGFMDMVKFFEILGGLLVAIPKTRNFGLLILGPIIVNILAFNTFIVPGGLAQPPVVLVAVLGAFLLWAGRASFAKLLN